MRYSAPVTSTSTALDGVFAVVMAGGAGTRFWPASRRHRPKQLLSLVTERTLLEETVHRVAPSLVPYGRVLIVTGGHLAAPTYEAVGAMGVRLVVEPMARNTAPCLGLAAALVHAESPDGVLAVFAADHHIADTEGFRRLVTDATALAREGRIVTLGITPDRPETGYGYIRRGPALAGSAACAVDAFVEKPDRATAERYVADGRYLWNSGMFFLRADVLLASIEQHLPALAAGLRAYRAALGTADESAALHRCFEHAEPTSIDYGVMEREVARILVLPADMGWSDVGSWRTLLDFRPEGDSNLTRGPVDVVDTRGSVVVSVGARAPRVAVIGMEGVAVVATDDAVLVVPLDRAQDVGGIPKLLREQGLESLV